MINSLSSTMLEMLDCLPLDDGFTATLQRGVVYLNGSKPESPDGFGIVRMHDHYVVKALNDEELLYGYKVDRIEPAMYCMDKTTANDKNYQLKFCSAFRKHLPASSNCKDRIKDLTVVE